MFKPGGCPDLGSFLLVSLVMELPLDRDALCFPELLNASCKRLERSPYERGTMFVLMFGLSVLTAVLNLLVIVSILHFRQLQTQTNIFLLSLAFSDLLIGLLVMPIETLRLVTGCWYMGDLACKYVPFLVLIIVSSGVGTVVLIAVDRYVAICQPLQYTRKITIRRAKCGACLVWICSVSYNVVIMKRGMYTQSGPDSCYGECNLVITYVAGVIDSVVTAIGPVTVIIVLYGRVFVVAVSHARAMKSHSLRAAGPLVTTNKSELKAARTLGMLIFMFLLCFCPYYFPVFAGGDNDVAFAMPIFLWMMYLNSCINPVIYAILYPWFRKSIKLIVTLKILQPGSCHINMLSSEMVEGSK